MNHILLPQQTTIAIFLAQLAFGGAELVALNQARGLKKLGYNVILVVSRKGGGLYVEAKAEFEIYSLGSQKVFGGLSRLIAFLKLGRANILFSHYLNCNLVAVLAGMLAFSKTPIILIDHGLFPRSIAKYRFCVQRVIRIVAPLLYRKAERVVGISKIVVRETSKMSGIPQADIKIIYNPVIPEDFTERLSEKIDHSWFEQRGRKIVIAAGRFSPEKGFGPLLEAFAKVCEKEKAGLIILGDGKQRAELENMIGQLNLSDSVSLPGFQNNIFPWLQRADLFVLPSFSESFGNVLVEALACGTPVASSDLPGPSEILADGEYGLLLQVGNVQEMADCILKGLRAEKTDHEKLVSRGTFFSVQRAAQAYASLVTDVLGKEI